MGILREWNQYTNKREVIGGGVPVWIEMPKVFISGGLIANKLKENEYLAGGTPVEFNVKTKVAKLLKMWKVEKVSTSGDETLITVKKAWDLPHIEAGMCIMAMPSTLDGKGKSFLLDKVEDKDTEYIVHVKTADFDSIAKDKFIVESAETTTKSGASIYCKPNSLTYEQTVGGYQNTVGIARGHKYIYENTIPPIADVVKNAIPDLYFDYFNE